MNFSAKPVTFYEYYCNFSNLIVKADALRTITGNKRSDHVRVRDMLRSTKMLSMNQLAGYGLLLELWKSRAFDVPLLSSLHVKGGTSGMSLRSDTSNNLRATVVEPYSLCTEKLWNLTSDRFKLTNLVTVAKIEARATALQLPL